jgi:hypothetical protein
MKTNILKFAAILLILAGSFSACQSDDEKICDNFEKHGISNKEALIGEWKFDAFGFTVNGKKIKEKEMFEKGYINITDTGKIWFYYTNTCYFDYFIERNNIVCRNFISTNINDIDGKETPLLNIFDNSICYKIDDEKLYIHTRKTDNYNVLILKKK